MSFPFSVQNLRLNDKPKNSLKEEYTKNGLIKLKKIPTQDQQAFLNLTKELTNYSLGTEVKESMKKNASKIQQFPYLNMKYLAATLVLLHNNQLFSQTDDDSVSFSNEIFNDKSKANKIVYDILTKDNKDMIKIKQQLYIYAYSVTTNEGQLPTHIEEELDGEEFDEEFLEDDDDYR